MSHNATDHGYSIAGQLPAASDRQEPTDIVLAVLTEHLGAEKAGPLTDALAEALEAAGLSYAPIPLADEDYDDGYPGRCSNPKGHEWACTGTAYGGDDERWMGEGRSYCLWCGADGDG